MPAAERSRRKYLAGDFGSPHWYDDDAFADLVFRYGAQPDPPALGDFLGKFTGLSSSAARAKVRREAGLDGWQLTDLRGYRDRIPALLEAMRANARPPSLKSLGLLGKQHLLARLDQLGLGVEDGRHWYKQTDITFGGVPWIAEILVAETAVGPADSFWLMNHSALMYDQTSRTRLRGGEISAPGVSGMFASAHVNGFSDVEHVTVVHLICPAPTFTDQGKTALIPPYPFTRALGEAAWDATKTISREWEKATRDARRAENQRAQARTAGKTKRPTQRQAVFDNIMAAYRKGGGDVLPISCRSLFYQIRPLVEPLLDEHVELDYGYFKDLLAEYDRDHPDELPNLYYEARGVLIEPHDGKRIELGTREVVDYRPQKYLYNKILYVEKEGLDPVFNASQLRERYDMGIMFGGGYANVVARKLAGRLQTEQDVTIFVLHDADYTGYNIAITLAEETERMPDHHIEVIDLGLTVEAAIARNLTPENVTRKKALPRRLADRLNATEREWFEGEPAGGKSWKVQRVELNAFSSDALIGYVEERIDDELAARDLPAKVVPPTDVSEDHAFAQQRAAITLWVEEMIAAQMNIAGIVDTLVAEAPSVPDDLDDVITAVHEDIPTASWRAAVEGQVEADLDDTEDARLARFGELLREQIERLNGGAA